MASQICFDDMENFVPTSRTIDALVDIENKADMGTILGGLAVAVPFFQIFVGRDSYTVVNIVNLGYQVSTQDWVVFAGALSGVSRITRNQINAIATTEAWFSSGDDAVFWRCVYNATR